VRLAIVLALLIAALNFALALVWGALILGAAEADAHDWYPIECCSNGHCRPVACNELRVKGNYRFWGKYGWPIQFEKQSPDLQCHVCMINGVVICAFVPNQLVF
jgi:hypothetical protein